jgi:hypothetical protein
LDNRTRLANGRFVLVALRPCSGWAWSIMVLAVLGCGRPGGLTAPAKPLAARAPRPDWVESAGDLVRQIADFYHGVRSVRVKVLETHEPGESSTPSTRTTEIWVRRPHQIATRSEDGSLPDLISNLDQRFTIFRSQSRYFQGKSPGSIDDYSDNPSLLSAHGWGVMFIPVLFCERPYDAIMVGVDVLQYLGRETVDGVTAHRVRFEQSDMNWEMWFAAEAEPRLLKLEFDRLPGSGPADEEKTKATVVFRDWEFNADIASETFEFHPPAGFTRTPPTAEGEP